MSFYDTLQLDPAVIKPQIRDAQTKKERIKLQATMAFRSLLIVAFAIVFIAPLGTIFGSENSPLAVALFCILLGVRFVDFNYCIKDSMINLAIVFALLVFGPVVASVVPAPFAIIIHFVAFFTIVIMSCDKPEMGNGGLFNFAYIYLSGNPVTGDALWKRCGLALFGYVLCGIIFYCKHKNKNVGVRFSEVISQFNLDSQKCQWQLRLVIGVSVALTLGRLLGVERYMWAGFACGSLLSTYPYTDNVKQRSGYRMLGAVVGSAIFYVVYQLTPESMHSLLGPLGGFCLGFCTDYRFKTAINCLGALMMATSIYGPGTSVILRIIDNGLGILCGMAIVFLFQKFVDKRSERLVANAN